MQDAGPGRGSDRRSWRASPTESARLTPGGAVIESAGFLPLRPRVSESVGHAAFPGTLVRLGEGRFEVLAEESTPDGRVRYELREWAADQTVRQQVTYDQAFLGPVLAERRRLADRARSKWWSWLLYPFVGMLREERQIQACDRFGLEPRMATFVSGTIEATLALTLPRWGGALTLAALAWPWGGTAAARALFALFFGDVAGSPLTFFTRTAGGWLERPGRLRDLTALPLTRTAFWSRLARPDKMTQDEDGVWTGSALLPHLGWEVGQRLKMGDDFWNVSPLPATLQGGRLVHRYRLACFAEPGTSSNQPTPDPLVYQRSVRERVRREWDSLLSSLLFRWLVSTLPVEAQERALAGGDPARLRAAARVTWGLTMLLGLWFVTGAGGFNLLTGLVLFGDAAQRLPRVLAGEPAPSWFGHLVSDYLPPERDEYLRHRDAERSALSSIA